MKTAAVVYRMAQEGNEEARKRCQRSASFACMYSSFSGKVGAELSLNELMEYQVTCKQWGVGKVTFGTELKEETTWALRLPLTCRFDQLVEPSASAA